MYFRFPSQCCIPLTKNYLTCWKKYGDGACTALYTAYSYIVYTVVTWFTLLTRFTLFTLFTLFILLILLKSFTL